MLDTSTSLSEFQTFSECCTTQWVIAKVSVFDSKRRLVFVSLFVESLRGVAHSTKLTDHFFLLFVFLWVQLVLQP